MRCQEVAPRSHFGTRWPLEPLWSSSIRCWSDSELYLVGGLEHFLCSPIVGMMIQSDFHIFPDAWNHQPEIVSDFPEQIPCCFIRDFRLWICRKFAVEVTPAGRHSGMRSRKYAEPFFTPKSHEISARCLRNWAIFHGLTWRSFFYRKPIFGIPRLAGDELHGESESQEHHCSSHSPSIFGGPCGISKMGESTTRGLNKSPDLLTMQVLSEMII